MSNYASCSNQQKHIKQIWETSSPLSQLIWSWRWGINFVFCSFLQPHTYSTSLSLNLCWQPPFPALQLTYPSQIRAMDVYTNVIWDSVIPLEIMMCVIILILYILMTKKLMTASWVILDQTDKLEAWWRKRNCSNKRGRQMAAILALGKRKNNQEWKHIPPQLSFISFSSSKVHYCICSQEEAASCCVYWLSRL